MWDTAALTHHSAKEAYFSLLEDPKTAKIEEIILGKRITKEIVERIINENMGNLMLSSLNSFDLFNLPKGMRILELKMARGYLSIEEIKNAKDLKFSAEKLAALWSNKYPPEEAKRRYDHVNIIARNAGLEAYAEAKKNDVPFGEAMLNIVRHKMEQRHIDAIRDLLPECKYEYSIGFIFILTEDCTLWWSLPFEIPSEDTN